MTKAELIKALEPFPDNIKIGLGVWGEDVAVVKQYKLNHYGGLSEDMVIVATEKEKEDFEY